MAGLRKYFITLGILILSLFFPLQIFAQNYGNNDYGAGLYGTGATPAPTSNPNSSSGNNSSGSSPNNNSGGGCSATAPGTPDLFQINASSNQSTLFITKPSGNVNKYNISYGYDPLVKEFSTTIDIDSRIWIAEVIIGQLAPNTVYYFKASAVNDCVPGPASNPIGIKTTGNPKSITKFYKSSNPVQKVISNMKSTAAKATTKAQTAPPSLTQPNSAPQPANPPSAPQPPTSPSRPAASPSAQKSNPGFFSSVVNTVKGWFSF